MNRHWSFLFHLLISIGGLLTSIPARATDLPPIQTVFVIVLENKSWSTVKGNANASYLNQVLLRQAAYCEGYLGFSNFDASLPNYIWMEAGTNFGILANDPPSMLHLNSTNHLTRLLENAGISWRGYFENAPSNIVPLTDYSGYAVRHNPFAYFDDVTGTNDPSFSYGIAHLRPYSEFAADLTNSSVARYNFIVPNICNDGHDSCWPVNDPVRQSDDWLAVEVPRITNAAAFKNGGVLFITYDESEGPDNHLGFLALSPLARGGYWNQIPYTHNSFVRTLQEIFGVGPWLGDAANAGNLADLFCPYLVSDVYNVPGGGLRLTFSGVIPGRTNLVQASTNLANWTTLAAMVATSNSFTLTDYDATNYGRRFYRLMQVP